jgi:hypothetical protein
MSLEEEKVEFAKKLLNLTKLHGKQPVTTEQAIFIVTCQEPFTPWQLEKLLEIVTSLEYTNDAPSHPIFGSALAIVDINHTEKDAQSLQAVCEIEGLTLVGIRGVII